MNEPVLYLYTNNREKKQLRVLIDAVSSWEGFDKLVRYIELNYQSKILNSYVGPDAKRWIFEVNGQIIELIHSDAFGNYFLAPTVETEDLVREIGLDLEQRLKNTEE
jgi:hypothetical protein